MTENNSPQCELYKLDYTWKTQTSYTEFFQDAHRSYTRLSVYEIKNLFRFLDNKSAGHFDNKRWSDFHYLYFSKFLKCDIDQDCLLNKQELSQCFDNPDMKLILNYLPKSFSAEMLIIEIFFSLDYNKKGGINLNDYILLKKMIIGFNQYHVTGYLERDTFYSALKLSFIDYLIDEIDSKIAYKVAMNLMLHDGGLKVYFPVYFEICRLISIYFEFGVTIGEGFITKNQILMNYENVVYPSKMNMNFLKKYFSIFDEDGEYVNGITTDLNSNNVLGKFDESTMRFEDFTNLEFWANIFTNYTSNYFLNVTEFTNLMMDNKYVNPNFINYIGYSNFEDLSKENINQEASVNSMNITEVDFLNGYHFSFLEMHSKLETKLRKKNLNQKINSDNILQFESKEKLKSLFELNLGDHLEHESDQKDGGTKPSEKQVTDALKNYFDIMDKNKDAKLNFDEFIIFIKFLKIFQKLNEDNDDLRGIIKTEKVNLINQFVINPKLTTREKTRIQTFDTIPCKYVDFLLFFDFMYAPKMLRRYLINPDENYVDEINLQITMKIMNLYSDINTKNFQGILGTNSVKFDYEPILNVGLKNKCISNQKLYEKNKPNFKNTSNNRNTKLPSDPVLNGAGMDLAYY